MLRHGIRVAVAILTFSIGLAIFWPLRLIQRFETALVDRFYDIDDHDLRPISLTVDSATDANEIYRLLIHEQIKSNDEVKLMVLEAETTSFVMVEDNSLEPEWKHPTAFHKMLKETMPDAESQTLDNYLLRNETPELLKVWNLDVKHVLVTRSDLPDSLGDFWGEFAKKFPNSAGLISFSKVGFNNQHDQALVYVGLSCGWLCGEGKYVLLKKVNGKWAIQKEQSLWVS